MRKKQKIGIVVVAAGSGTRCGYDIPKQYMALGRYRVLDITIQRIRGIYPDTPIVIVYNPKHQALLDMCDIDGCEVVHGGATRQLSVQAGLQALTPYEIDTVLIHDAARPFVSAIMCERLIDALQIQQAAIPALAVADTLKLVEGAIVKGTLDRTHIYTVQTPQAFHYASILALHEQQMAQHATDDASLCEQAGIAVAIVQGCSDAFKITTQEDMQRAKQKMAAMRETRTGLGFDVHQLVPHNDEVSEQEQYIRLGGIDIVHSHRLKGHSDADVVLHAITDAILGAIGEGDIGQHFPPTDDSFAGMDSVVFLEKAYRLMRDTGGYVTHIDVTIIGEQPKINLYKEKMKSRIAAILELHPSRLNIKATTTERLGFTGRKEGIAVQAITTVSMPVEEVER